MGRAMAAQINLDEPEKSRLKREFLCDQVKVFEVHLSSLLRIDLVSSLFKQGVHPAWDLIKF